jgi:hypothetical protein
MYEKICKNIIYLEMLRYNLPIVIVFQNDCLQQCSIEEVYRYFKDRNIENSMAERKHKDSSR